MNPIPLPGWLTELLEHYPRAHLSTRDERRPHIVPVVFAEHAGFVYSPIDGKPKSHRTLQRERNLSAYPQAALLLDHYESDWSRLWWVRIDASARVVSTPADVVDALRAKYASYATTDVGTRAIRLSPTHIASWCADPENAPFPA